VDVVEDDHERAAAADLGGAVAREGRAPLLGRCRCRLGREDDGLEAGDRLGDAVLHHREVVLGEARDRLALRVHDHRVHRDELDRGREAGGLFGFFLGTGGDGEEDAGDEGRSRCRSRAPGPRLARLGHRRTRERS
jgi:hypothetical protein